MAEEPREQNKLGSPFWAACGTAGVAVGTRWDGGALQGSWNQAALRGTLRASAPRAISAGEGTRLFQSDNFWWLKN